MFRKRGHAETRRHRELQPASTGKEMRADLLADSFRHLARQFGSSVRQHDDKLVAAIASDRVCIANRGENHGGHFHQHVRSDEMSMLVVDVFEVVEIEEQRGHAGPITACAPDLVQQELSQVARVVQLCEIVCLRETLGFGDAHRVRIAPKRSATTVNRAKRLQSS